MEDQEPEAFEIAALISMKLADELNIQDEQKLDTWKSRSDDNLRLYNELLDEQTRERALNMMAGFDREAGYERINVQIETPIVPLHSRKRLWYRIAAAASILVIITTGIFIYRHHSQRQIAAVVQHDLMPGSNKAVLTLSNGSKINIDDHSNGAVAQQSGIHITKNGKGQLVYTITGNSTSATEYNTISTPNGGQYQVVLPDGTHVWLNSASSLRYPTRFSGNQRNVTLDGEGYFEVAHNSRMPFLISCGSQTVSVLGTHFNIHNYAGEPVVTTLLEGMVRISGTAKNAGSQVTLKPGQQATQGNMGFEVGRADVVEAVAWKDGQFIFHNTDLATIMREVQRWYDVRVDFTTLPNERYNAIISRNVPLSRLLQMLELTSNIKFQVNERRIMVHR